MQQDEDDNDPMSEALSLLDGEYSNSDEEEEEEDSLFMKLQNMSFEDLMLFHDKLCGKIPFTDLEQVLEDVGGRLLTEDSLYFSWSLKSAEKGIVSAQATVSELYELGRGVEMNLEKSIYWLKKAAEGGCANSQLLLGWAYHNGEGVDVNHELAFNWYKQSADLGNIDAFHRCGNLLLESKDYRGAMSWFMKGVEQGDGESMVDIGDMYRFGNGVECDPRKAFEWYESCTIKNFECASGFLSLAIAYHFGIGTPVDFKKSKTNYEIAAELGSETAMNNLADMYWKGQGLEKNYETALKWVKKSIDAGSNAGIATYGEIVLAEEKDYDKAFGLFKKSSDSGKCEFAHFLLGRMYENGWGCEKDISKAYLLYLQGAKEKDPPAIERLELPFKNGLLKSFQLCDVVIFTINEEDE